MGKITEDKNPFTRDFGTVASAFVARTLQQDDIERSFINEITDDKAYFIIGQRGFGKSSFLRDVKNKIAGHKEWIVYELRANNTNLIHELAANMYSDPLLSAQFSRLNFDFSLIGLGASISVNNKQRLEITSDEIAVKKMLSVVQKMNKKLLVAIDEISNTPQMRDFCALFNVCKGEGLPIYLLMDGLYKNTTSLENVADLTFLKRVEKLKVEWLEKSEVFSLYKKYLHLDDAANQKYADKLAGISKGYPYAFQLIGYYTWLWLREDEDLLRRDFASYEERLYNQIDRNLNDYVYSTIWDEISPTEKDILSVMACFGVRKVIDIRTKYNEIFTDRALMTSGNFSGYRDKLIRLNILRSDSNTMVDFALPRFELYAMLNRNDRIEFEY